VRVKRVKVQVLLCLRCVHIRKALVLTRWASRISSQKFQVSNNLCSFVATRSTHQTFQPLTRPSSPLNNKNKQGRAIGRQVVCCKSRSSVQKFPRVQKIKRADCIGVPPTDLLLPLRDIGVTIFPRYCIAFPLPVHFGCNAISGDINDASNSLNYFPPSPLTHVTSTFDQTTPLHKSAPSWSYLANQQPS